jgi:hypothetical protein
METKDLDNRFRHHEPSTEKAKLHNFVRLFTRDLAGDFDEMLPDSREKSLAITKLEEAMFWANAAIARTPLPSEGSLN